MRVDERTPDLFAAKPVSGRALRDRGMAQALAAERREWCEQAGAFMLLYAHTGPFVVEEVRAAWLASGRQAPHHPNVWGALATSLSREKRIVPTGRMRLAVSAKTHMHRVLEWRLP